MAWAGTVRARCLVSAGTRETTPRSSNRSCVMYLGDTAVPETRLFYCGRVMYPEIRLFLLVPETYNL